MTGEHDGYRIPRVQTGSSPQAILSTVLADYTFDDVALTTPSIVGILADFGISPSAARSAASRVTARGLLDAERRGRTAIYRLSPAARAGHAGRYARVVGFAATEPTWDGAWTIALEQPGGDTADRRAWRSELADLGVIRIGEATWGSPRDLRATIAAIAERRGVPVRLARSVLERAGGAGDPVEAVDLDAIAEIYASVLHTLDADLGALDAGTMTAERALVARTEALRAWRTASLTDPLLPAELLPDGWPRARARAAFVRVRGGTRDAAVARLAALLAPSDPDAARRIRAYG